MGKEKGVLRKKRRMKLTEKADGWGKDKDDLKWKENRRKREKKRETVCAIKDFKSKYYANTSLASNGASMLKHESERPAKESRKRETTRAALAFSWMNYTRLLNI